MADPFVGQITLFPYAYAPVGWADCDGSLLPINRYPALFALLGNKFGGDGKTSFALPDLRGRAALGTGQHTGGSTYSLGQQGGAETVPLTANMIAAHSHPLMASTAQGDTNAPATAVLANAIAGTLQGRDHGNIYNAGVPGTVLTANSLQASGSNNPGAHPNIQPGLVLRYCIALTGVFPQRP